MALALGISVANATTPTLCTDSATCTTDQSSTFGLQWGSIDNVTVNNTIINNSTTGTSQNQKFYQPQLSSNGNSPIDKLIINLGGIRSNTTNSNSGVTHTINTGSKFFTLKSGDRGIQLGSNGSGTMTIYTARTNGLMHGTTTTLVFDKDSNSKYALFGNLEIWGAKDTTNYTTAQFNDSSTGAMDYKELSKFSVTINGDMKGNITIRNQNYRNNNNNGTTGVITFTGNSNLDGDLRLTHDGVTDYYPHIVGVKLTQGKHTITFGDSSSPNSAKTNTITGSLDLEFGKNTIAFYNNAVIGEKINAGFIGNENTGIDETYQPGDPTQVNRTSQNTITFYETAQIVGKNGTYNSESRKIAIQATGGSSNTIEFQKQATIQGDILTCTTCLGGAGVNTLNFLGDATISGRIWSDVGTNKIIFSGGTTKVQDIGASGGKNAIISNNDLTLGVNNSNVAITIKSKRFSVDNLLDIKGNANFVENANITNIQDGPGYTITLNNILKFGGDVSFGSDKKIIELTAGKNWDVSTLNNVLSFEGNNSQNITIDDINKQDTLKNSGGTTQNLATGNNYIGKGFTTGSGDGLALNTTLFSDNSWTDVSHQANITLTITNDVFTNSGNNYINVATLNAKNIIANGGSNNIIATANITGYIKTSNGSNQIIFNDNSSISGGIWTTGNNNTKTIITLNGVSNTINGTVAGDSETNGTYAIVTNYGATTLEINSDNSQTNIGNVWHRYRTTQATTFNVNGSNSILTLENLKIHGNGNKNIGVVFNFSQGGTLNFTNGINLLNENVQKPKVTFTFGGDGVITGNLTSNRSDSQTTFNLANSTLTFKGNIGENTLNNATNITLNSDASSALVLQGQTNTITTLTTSGDSASLILDTTTQAVTTTISNAIVGNNLSVALGGSTNNIATLTLNNANGDSTITSLTLKNDTNATQNIFNLNANKTTVTDNIDVGSSKGLTINLANNTELALNKGMSGDGNSIINVDSTSANNSATLSGGDTTINTIKLTGSNNQASLTLKNSNLTIATLTLGSGTQEFSLDSADNRVIASIGSAVNGNNLTINLNGQGAGKEAELTLSNNANTINTLSLGTNSTANKLILTGGSSAKTTITNALDVDSGQEMTFVLGNQIELALAGGLDSRVVSSDDKGTTTLTLQDTTGGVTATITGEGSKITNLDFTGSIASQILKVHNENISFGTITANNAAGSILRLDASNANNAVKISTNTISGNNLEVQFNGVTSHTATLSMNENGTIKSLTLGSNSANTAEAYNTLEITAGNTIITNKIDASGANTGINLEVKSGAILELQGGIDNGATSTYAITRSAKTATSGVAKILLENNSVLRIGATSSISSISVSDGVAWVDLTQTDLSNTIASRSANTFKTLAIGDNSNNGIFSGNLNTVLFVGNNIDGSKGADKIIVNGNNSSSANLTLYANGNPNEILTITEADNVVVAEVGDSGISVSGGIDDLGGELILIKVKETDTKGTWIIQGAESRGVDVAHRELASTVLTVNYDLYLANFNSLNKRMGELRDNPYNQGVWARVFGGAMSNDFGTGSKTQYITTQAGYDYALSTGNGAKNYIGVAVAYGHSNTVGNPTSNPSSATLDNVNSNMAEVAIYNSYIEDSGWYNDTIFKFDYIMSDLSLVSLGSFQITSTNNFAMILSDEFGYRYNFGGDKSWYIDPQLEVAFGYFNQSDFNQALAYTTMNATQDAILTLRSRIGASLGKKFNSARGFATLYVGAFYEYDYIEGGEANTTVRSVNNTLDSIQSNGRAIINVGSNIALTENARLYIDVEKSFGDKQRTDMQFNFGARYSFGEKDSTTSYQETQKKTVAPLKIEDKEQK